MKQVEEDRLEYVREFAIGLDLYAKKLEEEK